MPSAWYTPSQISPWPILLPPSALYPNITSLMKSSLATPSESTISPHPNALHNSALSSPQHLSPSNILYMFYSSCSLSVSSTLTHQKTKSIKSEIFDCSGYCSMSRAQRSPSTESALHRRCLKSLLRELKRLPLQWSITHPNYIGSTTIT